MPLTEADKERLRLQGISKQARGVFFNGRRKDTKGAHFSDHCCYNCGQRFPCELGEKCDHAVYVRIGRCCDSTAGQKR